jgi:hypothetical protein
MSKGTKSKERMMERRMDERKIGIMENKLRQRNRNGEKEESIMEEIKR